MAEIVLTPGQRAAVESRGCALLVAAAAGSGKTRVLIDRVLDQVIREGRCVDEFLLITFTQAAAADAQCHGLRCCQRLQGLRTGFQPRQGP